ncbi:MAG: hypothetical protein GF317_18585 [Candidatus Lokiarchaeota archaeon]|nr:hypothetical protein [Candidatus Lokiarchaeota archaeon]MBD3201524.1 hypothetical protein [Candidatus Lokiarchaeota archaeon]
MSIEDSKKANARIYFDSICGTLISILSISSIIFVGFNETISNLVFYYLALAFWIMWLFISIFLICLGIHTYYIEQHPEKRKDRTDLRPPII